MSAVAASQPKDSNTEEKNPAAGFERALYKLRMGSRADAMKVIVLVSDGRASAQAAIDGAHQAVSARGIPVRVPDGHAREHLL